MSDWRAENAEHSRQVRALVMKTLEPRTVWVVRIYDGYSCDQLEDIFVTEEAAKAWARESLAGRRYSVDEWTVREA